ncbi:MAG: crosslink repair DNA glycosylase YcaQ family protein, partial [Candidatus Neomarinimicrobiota bacterium]
WVNTKMPTPGECAQFNILKALEVNGVARKQELFYMFQTMQKSDLDQAFNDLIDLGEIQPIEIIGLNSSKYFILKKNIELTNQLVLSNNNKVVILSPFDNFIIDRIRMKKLYDFEYALECYLPVTKRIYGYFVMPLLWNGKLIGRLDPKADRTNKVLEIHRIIFEENFNDFNKIQGPLLEALNHFALFNGCDHIHIKEIIPKNQHKLLKAKIDVTS